MKIILSTFALFFVSTLAFSQINFDERVNLYDDTYALESNRYVIANDIDNDGDNDLICFSDWHTSRLYWYENVDGDFNYHARKYISELEYINDLSVADIDGDGFNDILATHYYEKKIIWFKNLNGISFSSENEILTLPAEFPRFRMLHLADLDGDGLNDILAGAHDDNGLYLMNNLGEGNFSEPVHISDFWMYVNEIKTIDIDNDGDLDVFVGKYSEGLSILINNGTGQLSEPIGFSSTVNNGRGFSFSDYDNDGFNDLIVADGDDSIVLFRTVVDEETNELSFEKINLLTGLNEPSNVQIVDIDHDNDPDIFYNTSGINGVFGWVENIDGTFNDFNLISDNFLGSTCILTDDFNNDSQSDFLLSFYSHGNMELQTPERISIFYNNENNQFKEEYVDYKFMVLSDVVIEDFNNDQVLDLGILGGYGMTWFENRGDSELSSYRVFEETVGDMGSLNIWEYLYEDFNNDGLKDVIATYSGGELTKVFKNEGNNQFRLLNIYESTSQHRIESPMFLDIDGDGFKDFLYLYIENSNHRPHVYWLRNLNGNKFLDFEDAIEINLDYQMFAYNKFKTADINNDGLIDLVGGSSQSWRVDWFENIGNGLFLRHDITNSSHIIDDFLLNDVDNDGDTDIVTHQFVPFSNNSVIKYYKNNGNGVFGGINVDADQSAKSLALEDLNNDNLLDVIGCSYISNNENDYTQVFVYLNQGSYYGNKMVIEGNIEAIYSDCSVGALDINNDNKKEIFLTNSVDLIGYYKNNSILEVEDISNNHKNSFTLYPNPFSEFINWNEKDNFELNKLYSITITDLTGKSLYQNNTRNTFLDLKFLPQGVYLFTIQSAGETSTFKIIKK